MKESDMYRVLLEQKVRYIYAHQITDIFTRNYSEDNGVEQNIGLMNRLKTMFPAHRAEIHGAFNSLRLLGE